MAITDSAARHHLIEDLFGPAPYAAPQISPDGQRLAYLAADGASTALRVGTLPHLSDARTLTTGRITAMTWWPGDGGRIGYQSDGQGDEAYRLYDIDADSAQPHIRELTPAGVRTRIFGRSHVAGAILVGLYQRDPRVPDLYRLDASTGTLNEVVRNPGDLIDVLADAQGRPRAALAVRDDGAQAIVARERDAPDAPWRTVLEVPFTATCDTRLLSVDPDGRRILAATPVGAPAARLVWIELSTGQIEEVLGDEHFDIARYHYEYLEDPSLLLDPETGQPRLVAVEEHERRTWRAVQTRDETLANLLASLDDGDPLIVSRDRGETRWIVGYTRPNRATRFLLVEPALGRGQQLFEDRPALTTYALRTPRVTTCTARDGLRLPVYLTSPATGARGPLPAVVKIHGGPHHRDLPGLDREAQLLAALGYLCVQIQFRGSNGFGTAFETAGHRQWDEAMRHDLHDTVHALIAQDLIDPLRVALWGHSYGGYAALSAFTRPDGVDYRCALALNPVVNLNTFLEQMPPWWQPRKAEWHHRIADPAHDAQMLTERSISNRPEAFTGPVLLAHGRQDPRICADATALLAAHLRYLGRTCDYLLLDDGHNLTGSESTLEYYHAVVGFLAAHMPEPHVTATTDDTSPPAR
jgi:dipeptidyl aminopeptidase/acylaminoacyl peptidase